MVESAEPNIIVREFVDLSRVPNWRHQPASLLWPLGEKPNGVLVIGSDTKIPLSPDAQALRNKIPQTSTSFPGPLANLDSLTFTTDGKIVLGSSSTDFFDYKAASYNFRDRQGENPVRPLSVQATLLTPSGELIAERRPKNLEDFPATISLFGGSINPDGAKDPTKTLQTVLGKKQGLELTDEQLELTGIGRDNVNNVFTIFYFARLNSEQVKKLLEQRKGTEKIYYVVSTDPQKEFVERLLQHRDVSRWNPLGYLNVLYALVASAVRSKEEVEKMFDETGILKETLNYRYPMENILENDGK